MEKLQIQLFGGRGSRSGLGVGGPKIGFAENPTNNSKTKEINCNRFSTLKEWEANIRGLGYEVLVVFKNGKPIKAYRGVESEVKPPKEDYSRWNNCVITHNHPKNGTFSIDDLRMFASYDYKEIRAVVVDGVFVFRQNVDNPDYDGLAVDIKTMAKRFELNLNNKIDKLKDEYKSGLYDMSIIEFNNYILEIQLNEYKKFYKYLAERNGFEYKRMYFKKYN